jgi:hypothetical protein
MQAAPLWMRNFPQLGRFLADRKPFLNSTLTETTPASPIGRLELLVEVLRHLRGYVRRASGRWDVSRCMAVAFV